MVQPELGASPAPPSAAAQVRELVSALHARALQPAPGTQQLVAALCDTAWLLSDASSACAQQLRAELAGTTSLHPAMIEWGLETTLASVEPNLLRELASNVQDTTHSVPVPRALVAVVLAGNLFSAALRALFLPLLTGAQVIAKPASGCEAFARALQRALLQVDAQVGQRLALVTFARRDSAATRALFAQVGAVSAYGDDATLRELAAQTPAGTRFIAHGHGLSAAYIDRSWLSQARRARDAADRLALDVAAYDQRGCLSPHVVLVEQGGAITPRAFAELLARESLPLLERVLPRGPLATEERAALLQWRAAAAVRGELFAADSHAVSFEAAQPVRPSPGARHIGVYACAGSAALLPALLSFQPHLKCIGVAASLEGTAALHSELQRLGSPSVCALGTMQTPRFDADADGHAALDGLYEFMQVE